MIVLTILLSATSLYVYAQQWILAKKLDVANGGLPQNTCADVYFDKTSGFLWIATEGGLVRYDGKEQQVFDMHNMSGVTSPRMGRFLCTTDGSVFTVAIPGTPVVIRNNRAVAIEASIGSYWLALTRASRVSVSYLLTHRLVYPTGYNDVYASSHFLSLIWVNDTERVSVYTDSVYYFSGDRMTRKWACSFPQDVTLIRKKDGIYIADGSRWYFLDTRKYTLRAVSVSGLLLQPGTRLFYSGHERQEPLLVDGTDVYEIKFKDHVPVTQLLAHLPSLPGNIRALTVNPDRQQIYCATELSGLFIYQAANFRLYNVPSTGEGKSGISETERNAANNCYATVQTDSNHLLTHTGIHYNLSDGSFERVKFPVMMSGERARKGMASLGGGWVMSSGPGVYNIKTGKSRTVEANQYAVYCGTTDSCHWFGSQDINLCRNDSLICIVPYNRFPDTLRKLLGFGGFYDMRIAGVTYDKRLLISYDNCFMTIDTARKTVLVKFLMNKTPGRVPIMDTSGLYCWIPTYGDGIYLYDVKENHLYPAPMDARKYLAYSHTLAPDGQGNLLIPTNNGLFRINRNALIHACRYQEKAVAYEFYNIDNGLNCTEFNGGCVPVFNKQGNGDIIFPSQNGLERVLVHSFPNARRYPLYVEEIATADTQYNYREGISFPEKERTLTLHLGFGQWSALYGTALAYRLDDQPNWTYMPAGSRSIQLVDLAGGDHRLQLRNQYSLSAEEFQVMTVKFHIERKYYERFIFWAVLVVALAVLTWFIVQLVTRELRRRNMLLEEKVAEKTWEINAKNVELEDTLDNLRHSMVILGNNSSFQKRLLSLMGHDFMVPLQYISKVSGQLSQYKERLSKATREESIDEINSTATSLMYLGQNIIQWIRLQEGGFTIQYEYFRLDKAIDKLLQLHYQLAATKRNELSVFLEHEYLLRYDPVAIRIIIHNLLTNANKFTAAGTISLRVYNDEHTLRIEVQDNGAGMDAATLNSLNQMQVVKSASGTDNETGWGLGYRLIIDLLEISNGRLVVRSEKGQGTTVTIFLPDAI